MRLLITALLLLAASPALATGVPLTLSTTGYLLGPTDQPLSQAGLSVGFSLWNDPQAQLPSARVWPASGETSCTVDVTNGFYAVVLEGSASSGCGAGLASDAIPGDQPRYLQISVGGIALLPRVRLGAVANAALATRALEATTVGGETLANLHDASRLTGAVPANALGTGSSGLTTLGTITTGTWNGTPIADAWVAGASLWNAKLASVTHDGTLTGGGTAGSPLGVNVGTTAGSVAAGDDARFGRWSGGPTGLDAVAGRTSLGLGTAATANTTAFATAAQGATADAALPRAGGTVTGALTLPGSGGWAANGNVGVGVAPGTDRLSVAGRLKANELAVGTIVEARGRYAGPLAAPLWITFAKASVVDLWGGSSITADVMIMDDSQAYRRCELTVFLRSQGDLVTDRPLVRWGATCIGNTTANAAGLPATTPPVRVVKTSDTNNGPKVYELQATGIDASWPMISWIARYDATQPAYTFEVSTAGDTAGTPLSAPNLAWEGASQGPGASGSIVGFAYALDNVFHDYPATIPWDDTIPQQTEGNLLLSATLTPKSATDLLRITAEVKWTEPANHSDFFTIAAFRDAGADAIATSAFSASTTCSSAQSGYPTVCTATLHHIVAAGSTAATTIKIRVGLNSGNVHINGSGSRKLGGTMNSYLSVEEIVP